MGHKVNPIAFRLGITEGSRSRWFADKKTFGKFVVEDEKIRQYVKKHYSYAGIPKIEIERTRDDVKVILNTARPGVIIGRKGAEVDRLRTDLERLTGRPVAVDIRDVPKPELSAQLVAEGIAEQLIKRSPVRRTIKRAAETSFQAGAKGVKIVLGGRLGGSEMARRERLVLGSIPLHTLRADIDYGLTEAKTTAGQVGIKVWIYKGLVSAPAARPAVKETTNAPDAEKGQVPKIAKR
jgi:small subunit ribosomal protein S3